VKRYDSKKAPVCSHSVQDCGGAFLRDLGDVGGHRRRRRGRQDHAGRVGECRGDKEVSSPPPFQRKCPSSILLRPPSLPEWRGGESNNLRARAHPRLRRAFVQNPLTQLWRERGREGKRDMKASRRNDSTDGREANTTEGEFAVRARGAGCCSRGSSPSAAAAVGFGAFARWISADFPPPLSVTALPIILCGRLQPHPSVLSSSAAGDVDRLQEGDHRAREGGRRVSQALLPPKQGEPRGEPR